MHKSLSRFFVLALVAMALMMLVGSVAAVGPTVTPGFDASATLEGGVRFRNFGHPTRTNGYDVAVGTDVQDFSPDGVTYDSGSGFPYASGSAVAFEYDGAKLDATHPINFGTGSSVLSYASGDLGPLNYMQISVVCRKAGSTMEFKNVELDGTPLGDFVPTACNGFYDWMVTDVDLTAGFSLTGELHFSGADGASDEQNKVQVVVGYLEPPPSVTPVSEDPLVCDEGTVNIVIDDVENLYGYEFEVTYDHTLVDATGSFVDDWFLDAAPGLSVAGWQGDCSLGVCKFSQTRQLPDATELATTDPQVIASILFENPVEAGVFDVVVQNVKLTDKDSFEIPGAVGGSLQVNVCGTADVSGQINLQGRPQPGSPFAGISGGTDVDFEVVLDGPFGIFSATPSSTDGTYTVTGVKYLLLGTDYTISADHSIYLQASKTLDVNEAVETGQDTTLLGGDADNSGFVDISDVACVGPYFGQSALGLDGYVCDGLAVPTSADLNYDDQVNVQDLALVGGNYGLGEDQGW